MKQDSYKNKKNAFFLPFVFNYALRVLIYHISSFKRTTIKDSMSGNDINEDRYAMV